MLQYNETKSGRCCVLNKIIQSCFTLFVLPSESNTNDVCHLCSLPEIRVAVRMISEWFKNDGRITVSAAVFSDGTYLFFILLYYTYVLHIMFQPVVWLYALFWNSKTVQYYSIWKQIDPRVHCNNVIKLYCKLIYIWYSLWTFRKCIGLI